MGQGTNGSRAADSQPGWVVGKPCRLFLPLRETSRTSPRHVASPCARVCRLLTSSNRVTGPGSPPCATRRSGSQTDSALMWLPLTIRTTRWVTAFKAASTLWQLSPDGSGTIIRPRHQRITWHLRRPTKPTR